MSLRHSATERRGRRTECPPFAFDPRSASAPRRRTRLRTKSHRFTLCRNACLRRRARRKRRCNRLQGFAQNGIALECQRLISPLQPVATERRRSMAPSQSRIRPPRIRFRIYLSRRQLLSRSPRFYLSEVDGQVHRSIHGSPEHRRGRGEVGTWVGLSQHAERAHGQLLMVSRPSITILAIGWVACAPGKQLRQQARQMRRSMSRSHRFQHQKI